MFYYLTYPFFFTFFRLAFRVLGRLQSSGEHHVPIQGAFLYCPNHTTDADPPLMLAAAPRRCWFIGKEELYDIKILGWMLAHFHTFPIKRDSPDRAALRRAEKLLCAGEPLTIIPGRPLFGERQAAAPPARVSHAGGPRRRADRSGRDRA